MDEDQIMGMGNDLPSGMDGSDFMDWSEMKKKMGSAPAEAVEHDEL